MMYIQHNNVTVTWFTEGRRELEARGQSLTLLETKGVSKVSVPKVLRTLMRGPLGPS